MLEVIDAFVDGERVDPRALKDALADPSGRDYFVEVWMLREGMQEDRESRVADPVPVPLAAAPKRAFSKWVAAAAVVAGVAGGAGGYLAGSRTSPGSPAPATAPTPVAALPAAPSPAVFPAPQPTRVIQLEFQLDSTASGGD